MNLPFLTSCATLAAIMTVQAPTLAVATAGVDTAVATHPAVTNTGPAVLRS